MAPEESAALVRERADEAREPVNVVQEQVTVARVVVATQGEAMADAAKHRAASRDHAGEFRLGHLRRRRHPWHWR